MCNRILHSQKKQGRALGVAPQVLDAGGQTFAKCVLMWSQMSRRRAPNSTTVSVQGCLFCVTASRCLIRAAAQSGFVLVRDLASAPLSSARAKWNQGGTHEKKLAWTSLTVWGPLGPERNPGGTHEKNTSLDDFREVEPSRNPLEPRPEPTQMEGSLVRNHHFGWTPGLLL